jgi:hypothetical protein
MGQNRGPAVFDSFFEPARSVTVTAFDCTPRMLDARLVKPDLRGQFFKNLEIIKESFCWILIGHSLFKHNRFSYVFSNSWNNTPHMRHFWRKSATVLTLNGSHPRRRFRISESCDLFRMLGIDSRSALRGLAILEQTLC